MTDEHGADGARPDEVEALLRGVAVQERLRPEARAAHLERLRARAEALGPRGAQGRRRVAAASWSRIASVLQNRAAAAALALAVLAVLGTGGTALAARAALPGDLLYGVKTAVEQVASIRHTSAEAVVADRLERSGRRLDEVEALVEAGADAGLVAETLDAHDALLAEAVARAEGEPELEARVAEAAGVAAARLTALLEGGLPAGASDDAREALEMVLDRLDAGTETPGGPPGDTPAGPRPDPAPDAGPRPDRGPPDDAPGPPSDPPDDDAPGPPSDPPDDDGPPGQDRQPDTPGSDESGAGAAPDDPDARGQGTQDAPGAERRPDGDPPGSGSRPEESSGPGAGPSSP